MIAGAALLALTATPSAQPVEPGASVSDVVYECQYFRNEREVGDGLTHMVALRVVEHPGGGWTLDWGDRPPVTATRFDVDWALGLRWRDEKGKKRKAYIYFSEIISDNRVYFWLSVGKPSLWQPPGYGCESQGSERQGTLQ